MTEPKRTYSKSGKSKAAALAAKKAADAAKPRTGRPRELTDEIVAEILRRVADGETVTRICSDAHMPERHSVMRLAQADSIFCAALSRARESWADVQSDKIIEIADDSLNDWKTRTFAGKTEFVPDREAIDRSKLRIQARQWLMERFKKKVYSVDATKLNPADVTDAAEAIKSDATVIAPDEDLPPKPVL